MSDGPQRGRTEHAAGATPAIALERVALAPPSPGELAATTLRDGTRVCVGNADGQLFGVQDECTHSAFPLSEGTLLPGGVLQCSWHGARFDCRSGMALLEPAFEPLQRYEVREEKGAVLIGRIL